MARLYAGVSSYKSASAFPKTATDHTLDSMARASRRSTAASTRFFFFVGHSSASVVHALMLEKLPACLYTVATRTSRKFHTAPRDATGFAVGCFLLLTSPASSAVFQGGQSTEHADVLWACNCYRGTCPQKPYMYLGRPERPFPQLLPNRKPSKWQYSSWATVNDIAAAAHPYKGRASQISKNKMFHFRCAQHCFDEAFK